MNAKRQNINYTFFLFPYFEKTCKQGFTNLAIQIIYMLAPWHKGKIIIIKDVAPNTKLFTIEATTFEKFDFYQGNL